MDRKGIIREREWTNERKQIEEKSQVMNGEKAWVEHSDDAYTIEFSIKYSTQIGENIYILGSLKELGNWKESKMKLKWTEGHIWKGSLKLPSEITNFTYKFVCAGDKHMRWEQGADRIFDKSKFEINDDMINLDCVWEHFSISFNIYYPLSNSTEYMQVVGDLKELGSWFKNGASPIKMTLSEHKTIKGKI